MTGNNTLYTDQRINNANSWAADTDSLWAVQEILNGLPAKLKPVFHLIPTISLMIRGGVESSFALDKIVKYSYQAPHEKLMNAIIYMRILKDLSYDRWLKRVKM